MRVTFLFQSASHDLSSLKVSRSSLKVPLIFSFHSKDVLRSTQSAYHVQFSLKGSLKVLLMFQSKCLSCLTCTQRIPQSASYVRPAQNSFHSKDPSKCFSRCFLKVSLSCSLLSASHAALQCSLKRSVTGAYHAARFPCE